MRIHAQKNNNSKVPMSHHFHMPVNKKNEFIMNHKQTHNLTESMGAILHTAHPPQDKLDILGAWRPLPPRQNQGEQEDKQKREKKMEQKGKNRTRTTAE